MCAGHRWQQVGLAVTGSGQNPSMLRNPLLLQAKVPKADAETYARIVWSEHSLFFRFCVFVLFHPAQEYQRKTQHCRLVRTALQPNFLLAFRLLFSLSWNPSSRPLPSLALVWMPAPQLTESLCVLGLAQMLRQQRATRVACRAET